ncbi:MAG TPA: hypothetical protein PLP19_18405 [bacterium]|nr:hypothetical protein [bacterium]HPN45470.1 hypothetical protein [bacterium]
MYSRTQELLDLYSMIWRVCPSHPPVWTRSFTPAEQQQREAGLEQFITKIDEVNQLPATTGAESRMARQRFFANLREMAGSLLGFDRQQLDIIFSPAATQSAADFVAQARKFDPAIDPKDIYQAARNVWAMNGLQYFMGLEVKLTPSILAYSLLYPYTDNYLDDPAVSVIVKSKFNERFGRRINGERVHAANNYEQKIFALIGMIEQQWDRRKYPQVYESLIAIHLAQIKSLALLHHNGTAQNVDVTGISLEKGGTSVVADGYLIAGNLTREQQEFMFGYGAFLQFVDDLQDVNDDKQAGLLTIFTQENGHTPLDELINKTLHFGIRVMEFIDCFGANGKTEPMKKILSNTAVALTVDAAGRALRYTTPAYRDMLESRSPYRFSFLENRRKNIGSRSASLMKLLDLFAEPVTV